MSRWIDDLTDDAYDAHLDDLAYRRWVRNTLTDTPVDAWQRVDTSEAAFHRAEPDEGDDA